MDSIISDCYNKFSSYASLIEILSSFINDGTLEDSFLKQHPSSLKPKDEESFAYGVTPSIWGIVPPVDKNGLVLFEALKNAVANEQLRKNDLHEIVSLAAGYMRSLTSNIVEIQHDITDKIDHEGYLEQYAERKFNNFYKYDRYFITNLVRKHPKLEDFEKESEKIAVRLAYQTYYQVNTARFLYKEWQDTYFSRMDEFFRNSTILAERLYNMGKDKIISDDISEKRRYEHKDNMRNIAVIKEIASMGTKKILSIPDCYIDSQKEIRDSYNARFMKLRKVYLNNLKKQ
jgi:hypothetical protein